MKHASKTIQVYLVDDHRLVLDGLRQLLESTPDIRVCGTACSLRDARAGLSTVKPDMVVVDLSLADGNGLDLMDDPILRGRNCPVLVLSMRDEQFYAPQSIQRGARGFVSKSSPGEELLQAIRAVRAGHIHVGPTVATTLIERAACGRRSSRPPRAGGAITSLLGPREMTVFELIGRGHSTKEIAALLRISPKTVDTHRQRMRQKLRLPSATRLAALAITWSSNQSGVSPQP